MTYDLIVVGFERVGLLAAQQVRRTGWSVLVAGFRALDSLARSNSTSLCLQEELQHDGVDVVSGELKFVDRRIVEVSRKRYSGRQLLVAHPELEKLNLAAAQIAIVDGLPSVDLDNRSTSNPSVILVSAEPNPDSNLLHRAMQFAHTILGTASPLATQPSNKDTQL